MRIRHPSKSVYFPLIPMLISFLYFAWSPHTSQAATLRNTKIVVSTGDPSPDGSGFISSISPSSNDKTIMHNGGKIAFSSTIRDGEGFLVGAATYLVGVNGDDFEFLFKVGQPLPDSNGNLDSGYPRLLINNRNEVAFWSQIDASLNGSGEGILFTDGTEDGMKIVARIHQLAPDGEYKYWSLVAAVGTPVLNSRGQVGFGAHLVNSEKQQKYGLYRGNTANDTVTAIAELGDAAPEGTFGTIWWNHSLNESGQMSFQSNVVIDGASTIGIYRGNGVEPITEIVRKGDLEPTGDGKLFVNSPFNVPINDSGQVAFWSQLTENSGGTLDNEGIYRGDGTSVTEIVRKGDFTPDNNGRYLAFQWLIALNNPGQVLFKGYVSGATNDASEGLFLGDGTEIKQIVRLNEAAPGGGVFSSLGERLADVPQASLNEAGHVVFTGLVDLEDGGLTSDIAGVFYFDGTRVISVARVGDVIPGEGTITGIRLGNFENSHGVEPESTPFNDLGQVVYICSIGGNSHIAVWTPPLFADSFE